MNIVRRTVVFVHARPLELLLALSIVVLIGQLCWPDAVHWWRLPGPGQIGFDTLEAETLASEFLIQLPPAYRNEKLWPLVIFLHGSGSTGNNPNILRSEPVFRQALPAIVASPQCRPSYSWEPDAVADLIKCVASRYHVDRKRIYLVGHSMGAYGAWKTAAAHPELFAAIVPISGAGDVSDVKSLVGLSVWAFHGDKDKTIPVAESKRMVEAIQRDAGQPRLTILPGAGHAICETVCKRRDLWEWLFRQHRSE